MTLRDRRGTLSESVSRMLAGMLLMCLGWGAWGQDVPVVRYDVERFVVEGENPLSESRTDAVLAPFLGPHEGLEPLLEAANALEEALRDDGHAFYRVSLPQQTLKDGAVRLELVRFEIGAIEFEGNVHFGDDNILRSLPELKQGGSPNTRKLSQQVQLANQHPAKTVEVKFQESEVPGSVDARVLVSDVRPWTLFAVFNNTGTDETGDTRLTVGGQHTNLFDRDHQVTASYTTSPGHWSEVKQYGFNYRLPIYAVGGTLNASYVDSDVDSGVVAGIDISGRGKFGGLLYTHFLPRFDAYSHTAGVGIDDKLFENDAIIPGTGIVVPNAVDVRSRPVSFNYTGTYRHRDGTTRFYGTYARNITSGSHNDNLTYSIVRPGASNNWDVFRFGGSVDHGIVANWLLRGRLDAQSSDEPLIPGEQFGAGGARSVRGYDEREVTGDSGATGSVEAWTPPLPYAIRALGFFDAGYVSNKRVPNALRRQNLASTGLGVRWFWKQNLSIQADAAVVLHQAGLKNGGDSKLHFNIFYRY